MLRFVLAVVLAGALLPCITAKEVSRAVLSEDLPLQQHREESEFEFFVDPSSWPENGVPGDVNVYPSYEERAMGTWLNVVCSQHSSVFNPHITSKVMHCAYDRHESDSGGFEILISAHSFLTTVAVTFLIPRV